LLLRANVAFGKSSEELRQ